MYYVGQTIGRGVQLSESES